LIYDPRKGAGADKRYKSTVSKPIIEVQNLSKRYRLGTFGARSLREEVEMLWTRLRKRSGDGAHTPNAAAYNKEFWALRDISLAVQPGEVVGIIGRNGAGKSTLLKILSRITAPTSGEIIMRGRLASLLEVGTGFHPELTGRDNVYLNGAILGMKRAEITRKFDEIVAFAEIKDFIDTPVKRYSSGMYVRLAFAVAAHLEPEILIIDEVLAVGDVMFQRKCIGRMQEISANDGRTILFVSHSMTTVRRLCQKCGVLDAGRFLGMFPVDEAIEHYNSNIAVSDLDVNLAGRHPDLGTTGEHVRILRTRFLGEAGLRFNSPFAVEVTLEVRKPVRSAMVGFALNTTEGQRVMTLDSDGNGKTFDLDCGEHRVVLHLDRLPVSPGQYFCSVSIWTGKHAFDMHDSFALWEVETGVNDWESDRGFGGCRLRPAIEIMRGGTDRQEECFINAGQTQP